MSKKDLNIKSQLYSFSLLDNEDILEQELDQSVNRIKLYTALDFHCYMQALYDIAVKLIGERKLVEFCHLLNVYGENIYIGELCVAGGNRYITGFRQDLSIEDEWSPTWYAKQHMQHIIDKIVSVNFDHTHNSLDNYFSNVYITKHSIPVINVIFNVFSIPAHHSSDVIAEYAGGLYKTYPEYVDYRDLIEELVRNEMNVEGQPG